MYLLYYKVFGSKDISVGDAQKHLSLANAKRRSRSNILQNMLHHNEKVALENTRL